ncbi:uncharacterized protein LOC144137701 [Haemaphysalis longicornis]
MFSEPQMPSGTRTYKGVASSALPDGEGGRVVPASGPAADAAYRPPEQTLHCDSPAGLSGQPTSEPHHAALLTHCPGCAHDSTRGRGDEGHAVSANASYGAVGHPVSAEASYRAGGHPDSTNARYGAEGHPVSTNMGYGLRATRSYKNLAEVLISTQRRCWNSETSPQQHGRPDTIIKRGEANSTY